LLRTLSLIFHLLRLERIQRVGSPVPNPDLFKVGYKSVELISIRIFSGIPGSRSILYRDKGLTLVEIPQDSLIKVKEAARIVNTGEHSTEGLLQLLFKISYD